MISFESDYNNGMLPEILEALGHRVITLPSDNAEDNRAECGKKSKIPHDYPKIIHNKL